MKFRIAYFILLFLFFPFLKESFCKDIDLDGIYIKKESIFYKRLLNSKIDVHRAIGSLYIDNDVIFADWVNGRNIVYIKELSGINITYIYDMRRHKKREINRMLGTITYAGMSRNGRFLFIKRLLFEKYDKTSGETVIVNVMNGKVIKRATVYFFKDFTLSPDGNTYFSEGRKGIYEFYPTLNIKKLICRRIVYSGIADKNSPVFLYFSPNRKKMLLVGGSGGYYRSKILTKRKIWPVRGLTSASEIAWINNRFFIYRAGSPGNYSLIIYDTVKRMSRKLVSNSLNTNLNFSVHPGIVTFLKDQIIHILDLAEAKITNIGFEGEDVFFSPDGNRFTSLLQRKLFVTKRYTIEKQILKLRKKSTVILNIYKSLLKRKDCWVNEYTHNYLTKKYNAYKFLAGKK